MSKLSDFSEFLHKDLGITITKTGLDRNLGESDITTGDTAEERKEDAEKKAITQIVDGLSEHEDDKDE